MRCGIDIKKKNKSKYKIKNFRTKIDLYLDEHKSDHITNLMNRSIWKSSKGDKHNQMARRQQP